MPFLKFQKTPRSKILDESSKKKNLHHSVFTASGCSPYIGDWSNNLKNGKGTFLSKNNIIYEGDWENGLRHGYGVLSKKQEDESIILLYEGDWAYGKCHGFGRQHFANGEFYEGEMKNGKRSGIGRMWFNDGRFYDGQWLDNLFHGLGLCAYKNGNRYEGEWSKGLKHGRGEYYHLDSGQVQRGIWKIDYAVCTTMEDILFRFRAFQPTQYPINASELKDWQKVYNTQVHQILQELEVEEEDEVVEEMAEAHVEPPLSLWFYRECCGRSFPRKD